MPAICLHFHLHIPYKLRAYHFFQLGKSHEYFDHEANSHKVAQYAAEVIMPANRLLLDLLKRHKGQFQLALSISGVTIELLKRYSSESLTSLGDLTQTGYVEWLNYPFYHSLGFLYDRKSFSEELLKNKQYIQQHFEYTPQVLCNTHLIYNNFLAYYAHINQYKGVICEGVERILQKRSPNYIYNPSDIHDMGLLLRNNVLSEDIAFRFNDEYWNHFPLSPYEYASWLSSAKGDIVFLSMNYDIFQHKEKGIMSFFNHLPEAVLTHPKVVFLTPSQAFETLRPTGVYDVFETTSWHGHQRDISSLCGNPMQQEALEKLYDLSSIARNSSQNHKLIQAMELLQSVDIFHQMNEQGGQHLSNHSPYQAYSNYMTILADLALRTQPSVKTV